MKPMNDNSRLLTPEQATQTGLWLVDAQESKGELPWLPGGKFDPWNHVHGAMGLAVAGHFEQARKAYHYLAATQEADGAWPRWRVAERITDAAHETNQAAYVASGLWHLYLATEDDEFLAETWPMVERALDFVVALQFNDGSIAWARKKNGRPARYPLLTCNSSTHGSLVCGLRIAELLGHDKPGWRRSLLALGDILRDDLQRYYRETLAPDPPGRFSMDWYYPVLGGAVRGVAGRQLLLDDKQVARFLEEGNGLRCVAENRWFTVAETLEYAMALDALGLDKRAREVARWVLEHRTEHGAYQMGIVLPQRVYFPADEFSPWNAATVLLADDVLAQQGATAEFFRSLDGDDLLGEDIKSTGTGDSLPVTA